MTQHAVIEMCYSSETAGEKGHFRFNNTFNTFLLLLYGVGHMV